MSRRIAVSWSFCILWVWVLGGCSEVPIPVALSPDFDPPKIDRSCDREYLLILDEQSAQYELTENPDTWDGGMFLFTFPIGKTVSAFLAQAQKNQNGGVVPLRFSLSDFKYSIRSGFLQHQVADHVKYQAHFIGSSPIGTITIQEQATEDSYWLWEHWDERNVPIDQDTLYFAVVSRALQSTTIKLLTEVARRMCPKGG